MKMNTYGREKLLSAIYNFQNLEKIDELFYNITCKQPRINSSHVSSPSPLMSNSENILVARAIMTNYFMVFKEYYRYNIATALNETINHIYGLLMFPSPPELVTPSMSYNVPMISVISDSSIVPLSSLSYI